MRRLGDKVMRRLGIGLWLLAMVGCTQQPQQVRRLSEKQAPDSALLAQIEFNQHMSRAADNACRNIKLKVHDGILSGMFILISL